MTIPPVVVDSLERVGVSAGLAGVSLLAVEAKDWPVMWAPILVVILNTLKVFLAAQFGDPNTGGFAATEVTDTDPAEQLPETD